MIRGAAMIDLGRRVVAKRASVVSREEEGGGGKALLFLLQRRASLELPYQIAICVRASSSVMQSLPISSMS